MFEKFFLFFRRADKYLLGVSILLTLVGLLMIYSTTFSDPAKSTLLARQSGFFVLGLVVLFVAATFDYRHLKRLGRLFYVIAVLLLLLVLFMGPLISGSRRWFLLGFFQLQPVELTKLALIIILAWFFERRLPEIGKFKTIMISIVIMAVPAVLTLIQPDLGSALVLCGVWLGMLLSAGVRKKHLLWLFLFTVVLASSAWVYVLKDYQKDRVYSFLNPMSDPKGRSYNAIQAITAVGSGGLFGRGLARGVVSQLRFLPERQTDFIFASLAEELGFFGTSFLLALLGFWFYRIIKVASHARENFGFFLATGLFSYLFVQTVMNIAMNIGLLPITGVPLPLISYGGSSLVTVLLAIGILESVASHSQPIRFG